MGKTYYIYTPKAQRQKSNIISQRCNIYRQFEITNRGKNPKLCYGTLSLNKKTNEIYFSKSHSNYCDNLNKNPPTNIEDIDTEIFKKEELITKLTKFYKNNNFIGLVEFSKEAINEYNNLNCHFNVTTNIWKNVFNKIKNLNKKNSIDLILKNTTTIDRYQFFRTSDFSYNPFIKDNNISKYIIWSSDFNILRIKKTNIFLLMRHL